MSATLALASMIVLGNVHPDEKFWFTKERLCVQNLDIIKVVTPGKNP